MKISGDIYDKATGKGVPAATITIVDKNGIYAGAGTVASSNGRFEVASSALDNGGKIQVSSIGYTTAYVDPYVFLQTSMIGLQAGKGVDLETVVVYPQKKIIPFGGCWPPG